MLNELIERAKEIEQTTDANIQGAFVQVTNELTIDECEEALMERAGDDPRKIKRYTKKVGRVRVGKNPRLGDTVHSLRNDVFSILNVVYQEQRRATQTH